MKHINNRIKICVLGEDKIGKTTFISKWMQNKTWKTPGDSPDPTSCSIFEQIYDINTINTLNPLSSRPYFVYINYWDTLGFRHYEKIKTKNMSYSDYWISKYLNDKNDTTFSAFIFLFDYFRTETFDSSWSFALKIKYFLLVNCKNKKIMPKTFFWCLNYPYYDSSEDSVISSVFHKRLSDERLCTTKEEWNELLIWINIENEFDLLREMNKIIRDILHNNQVTPYQESEEEEGMSEEYEEDNKEGDNENERDVDSVIQGEGNEIKTFIKRKKSKNMKNKRKAKEVSMLDKFTNLFSLMTCCGERKRIDDIGVISEDHEEDEDISNEEEEDDNEDDEEEEEEDNTNINADVAQSKEREIINTKTVK